MLNPYHAEFPYMGSLGLYAAEIRGDGNCLFNALADQLYGSQDRHRELRLGTVDYIRDHKDMYKHYVEVHPGGATRRQPKRKSAPSSRYQDSFDVTEADVSKAFDAHLTRMAQGGTWGGNLEIVAFARAFEVNVKIYQDSVTYIITGTHPDGFVCHIAYHMTKRLITAKQWEHYSSVRNLNGPHTGKPEVKVAVLSPEEEAKVAAHVDGLMPASAVQQWQVDSLSSALDQDQPRDVLVRALQRSKGSVDDAWELLYKASPTPDHASCSSAPSSSLDHDDSEDNVASRPKRQDRRLSRASKTVQRRRVDQKSHVASNLGSFGDSLDSLLKACSTPDSSPTRSTSATLQRHVVYDKDADDTEDDDWQSSGLVPLKDGDTSSSSEYSEQATATATSSNAPSTTSNITLKLARASGKLGAVQPKRLGAARDMKTLKKQAQKQAARERKQAQFHSRPESVPMTSQLSNQSTTTTMTNGLKMVYL